MKGGHLDIELEQISADQCDWFSSVTTKLRCTAVKLVITKLAKK